MPYGQQPYGGTARPAVYNRPDMRGYSPALGMPTAPTPAYGAMEQELRDIPFGQQLQAMPLDGRTPEDFLRILFLLRQYMNPESGQGGYGDGF